MKTILLCILTGIIGFIIGRKTARTFSKKSDSEMDDMRKEAMEALTERAEKRKEKILETIKQAKNDFTVGCNLREGENKKGITANDVEKLFDVSNRTADRYLDELEAEGKIKQVGTSGKDVYYILAK
ncbi:hypothetical protein BMS3Abin15_00543 [bacterium BMS3Abin15]|nr:hypothetical protein BMS3Abin15_00543 [bacterium BMS3Abin15]HDL01139.1 hypothetical protein [candidate division Zixibacteria bacterium]HDZ86024.1 hypothetical protein [Candidatus Moranbacteria bacterium]